MTKAETALSSTLMNTSESRMVMFKRKPALECLYMVLDDIRLEDSRSLLLSALGNVSKFADQNARHREM